MICPRCGTRNSPGAATCRRCRALLTVRPAQPIRRPGGPPSAALIVLLLLGLAIGGGYLLGRKALPGAAGPAAPTASSTAQTVGGGPTTTTAPATVISAATATGSHVPPTPRHPTATPPGAQGARTPTPSATRTPGTSTPTPLATKTPGAGTPTVSPTTTPIATATSAAADTQRAALVAAVAASNAAWIRAVQDVSPAGLDAVKTEGSLRAAQALVAQLQQANEYYRIQPGTLEVLWTHLLSPTSAHVLARKTGEYRALYRQGGSTPLRATTDSSTSLYELRKVNGRWLVARIANGSTGAGEQPDPTPTPASGAPTPVAGATPDATLATPGPTGTPAVGQGQGVRMTLSADAGPLPTSTTGQAEAPASTARLRCQAVFAHLNAGDTVSFRWLGPNGQEIYTYDAPPASASAPGVTRWSYLVGPLSVGPSRCQVLVNGAVAGAAPFLVR